jgi:IS5 family transposase
VDQCAVREENLKGGRPAYPTETMVRILVLKRLNNHSYERMAFLLLDRLSYQRLCGLTHSLKVPDRTTIWSFDNRMGEAVAMALFEGVSRQLLKKGFIARGGQMIDAPLVPAPEQKMSRKEKEIIDQKATPSDWEPAQRRQKDTDATWTKKHGKSYFGYTLSVNVDKKHKIIRKIVMGTGSTGDTCHFENAFDLANTRRDVYADRGYPSK